MQRMDGIRLSFMSSQTPTTTIAPFNAINTMARDRISNYCFCSAQRLCAEPDGPRYVFHGASYSIRAIQLSVYLIAAKRANNSIRCNNELPGTIGPIDWRREWEWIYLLWQWFDRGWDIAFPTLSSTKSFSEVESAAAVAIQCVRGQLHGPFQQTTYSFNLFDRITSCLN